MSKNVDLVDSVSEKNYLTVLKSYKANDSLESKFPNRLLVGQFINS